MQDERAGRAVSRDIEALEGEWERRLLERELVIVKMGTWLNEAMQHMAAGTRLWTPGDHTPVAMARHYQETCDMIRDYNAQKMPTVVAEIQKVASAASGEGA